VVEVMMNIRFTSPMNGGVFLAILIKTAEIKGNLDPDLVKLTYKRKDL
jgi:hypothetical protein